MELACCLSSNVWHDGLRKSVCLEKVTKTINMKTSNCITAAALQTKQLKWHSSRWKVLRNSLGYPGSKWRQDVVEGGDVPHEFHFQSPIPIPDICMVLFLEGMEFLEGRLNFVISCLMMKYHDYQICDSGVCAVARLVEVGY